MSKTVSPPSKLLQAIRSGRLSSVIAALDDGADIEEADMHGARGLPLRVACFEGHTAIVRELLTRGADPNAPASDGPGGPLRLALRRNHKEVIALLVQFGSVIPEGVSIDPAMLATGSDSVLVEDILAPANPMASEEIELAEVSADFGGEDQENFGTATRAISADLMFLEEREELKLDEIQPSGRKSRVDPLA